MDCIELRGVTKPGAKIEVGINGNSGNSVSLVCSTAHPLTRS